VHRVGVIPTPAIAFLVAEGGADLGVVLSASHNPMPDNGIKIFARGGGKLDDLLEVAIENRIGEPWKRPTGKDVGRAINDDTAAERYLNHLLATVDTHLDGLKVVVDCANGASSYVAPEALRRAGAEVIAISDSPNGWNINENCGSTHMEALRENVLETKADIGIALDGDADRCLAVDAHGNSIDGDQIMSILAISLKQRGLLKGNCIVGTVMSNLGFMKAMKEADIDVITTPVGDRHVLERLIDSDCMIGGEQSGHVILKHFANTGDGILTALTLLQELSRSGKSVKELASVMTKFPQVLINVRNVAKGKLSTSGVVQDAVRAAEAELGASGRVLLRPSGTEPVIRVMVEASSDSVASAIASSLANIVQQELG
jgi:phosphoglucosamine mutase